VLPTWASPDYFSGSERGAAKKEKKKKVREI
jgi:hypothetical protein